MILGNALLRLIEDVFRGPCEILVGATHSLTSSGESEHGMLCPLDLAEKFRCQKGARPSQMLIEEVDPFHYPQWSDLLRPRL